MLGNHIPDVTHIIREFKDVVFLHGPVSSSKLDVMWIKPLLRISIFSFAGASESNVLHLDPWRELNLRMNR